MDWQTFNRLVREVRKSNMQPEDKETIIAALDAYTDMVYELREYGVISH